MHRAAEMQGVRTWPKNSKDTFPLYHHQHVITKSLEFLRPTFAFNEKHPKANGVFDGCLVYTR
jgi:hypothetical protein